MPSERVSLIAFAGTNPLTQKYERTLLGLTVTGPASGDAPMFMRRTRGLHEACLNELRPAPGRTPLFPLPTTASIHTITRFNDVRYFGAGTILFREGAALLTGLNGQRLTLTRMPPGNTQPDQLFVAGGGKGRKIDIADIVTNWGIDPPADGFTVALVAQLIKTIENFEVAGDWTIVGTGVIAANEATINQDGNSLKVTVPIDTLATLSKASVLDLSQFAVAGDSSDEDLIELWVRVDEADAGIDYITLRFDVGAGDFSSDYYQFKFLPTALIINTMVIEGVGKETTVAAGETTFVTDGGGDEESGGISESPSAVDSDPGPGTDAFGASSATWTRLRIAKSRFLRSGNSIATWANVAAIQLMIKTNTLSQVICYFDLSRMRGGAGLSGDYKSLVTFDSTLTGARSNGNPTEVVTKQNDRQKLDYAILPLSTDPQVNARTLWRTLGNGAAFFREHVIKDNTTTTYRSAVADFVGLWTNEQSEILFLPELPTDNIRPLETHIDFIYDQATVFWLNGDTAKKGRVYFSPSGRPEAQRGFIQVCQDDTPLFRILVWNRARYILGEAGIYRLDGIDTTIDKVTTHTYAAFKFQGVPGINAAQARTAVSCPQGIIWQAQDGLRIFTGSTSEFVQFERVGPLFRGESLEQITNFQGVCAAYCREQYFISDGINQTLSFNLGTGFIRDLGQGFTALYYEEDTRLLLGADSTGMCIIEDVGVRPTVPCTWQTASLYAPPGQVNTVQRLYIDANTDGQPINVTLVINKGQGAGDEEIALPPFSLIGRDMVEYPLGLAYISLGVRLSFEPQPQTRIYQIYADIYSPGNKAKA
jgi:hypothetical protein